MKQPYNGRAAYQVSPAYSQWALMKVMKETHLRKSKKHIYGVEQLPLSIYFNEGDAFYNWTMWEVLAMIPNS